MGDIKKTKVDQAMVAYKNIASQNCCVAVTEWDNGEGFDIAVDDRVLIQLSHEDFKAVCVAVNALELELSNE